MRVSTQRMSESGAPRPSESEARPASSVQRRPSCLERARLVTEVSVDAVEAGVPAIIARARALEHLARHLPINVAPGEQVVGRAAAPGAPPLYPELTLTRVDEELAAASGDRRRDLERIAERWRGRTAEEVCRRAAAEVEVEADLERPEVAVLGGALPDMSRFLRLGITGLVSEVRHYRCVLSVNAPDSQRRRDFYEAAEVAARAVVVFAERHAALARARAEAAPAAAAADFERVAEVCERVPLYPPDSFHEAVQALHFGLLAATRLESWAPTPALRLDQLLLPFYQRDRERGEVTFERAVALLEELLAHLVDDEVDGFDVGLLPAPSPAAPQVTLGGVDGEGRDATNELSSAVLEAAARLGEGAPRLVIRYHDRLDPAFLGAIHDGLSRGLRQVAFANDEATVAWQVSALLGHLDPAASRRLGIGSLELFESVRGSALGDIARAARSKGRRLIPEALRVSMGEATRWMPYKVGAGRSMLWRGLRGALDGTMILDAQRAVSLARSYLPGARAAPGVPGLIFDGAPAFALRCRIDLERALARAAEETLPADDGERAWFEATLARVSASLRAALEVDRQADLALAEAAPRPLTRLFNASGAVRGRDPSLLSDGSYTALWLTGVEAAVERLTAAGTAGASAEAELDRADDLVVELLRQVATTARQMRDHSGRAVELCLGPSDTLTGPETSAVEDPSRPWITALSRSAPIIERVPATVDRLASQLGSWAALGRWSLILSR